MLYHPHFSPSRCVSLSLFYLSPPCFCYRAINDWTAAFCLVCAERRAKQIATACNLFFFVCAQIYLPQYETQSPIHFSTKLLAYL